MLPVLLLNIQTFRSWLKLNTRYIQLPCKKLEALPTTLICKTLSNLAEICFLAKHVLDHQRDKAIYSSNCEDQSLPDFLFPLPPTGLRNHSNVTSPGQNFRQILPCPYKTGKCHCPHFKDRALRFFQDSLQNTLGTGGYKLLGNVFCYREVESYKASRGREIREIYKQQEGLGKNTGGEGRVGLC